MYAIEQSNIVGREFVRVNERLSFVRNQPESDFVVVLEGKPVPNISASLNSDGGWSIVLDDRYCFPFRVMDDETLEQMFALLANAMAVAAGFSCFGVDSRVINPYRKYPMPPDAQDDNNEVG